MRDTKSCSKVEGAERGDGDDLNYLRKRTKHFTHVCFRKRFGQCVQAGWGRCWGKAGPEVWTEESG